MDVSVRFGIYILIITNTIDNALLKPVQSNQGRTIAQNGRWKTEYDAEDLRQHHRLQRQVVQPTWLTELNGKLRTVDARVRVDEKNLQETAHIRKNIQDAVRRNEFAVLSPNAQTKSEEGGVAVEPPMPPPAVPQILPWSFPMHSNAPMWMPAAHGQHEFMVEMQRLWAEFIENSRRIFNRN